MIDSLFLLAAGSVGWGLSLALYRPIARLNRWPMGALHHDFPALPILVGLLALACGLNFAATRTAAADGWLIVVFGAFLCLFWTGFLRVGSQTALLLAPLATALLLAGWWLGAPTT
jgi:hypothetical protein